MSPITQNNKIALAAVSIFLASFGSMLIFIDGNGASPEYLKSDVIESAMNGESSHGGLHFNEGSPKTEEHNESESDTLKKQENLYRVLLNNFSDPFVVLEPSGKPEFLSSDFTEKYGFSMKSMNTKGFFTYINSKDLPDFVSEYTSVIQSGKASPKVGPYRFESLNGVEFVHMISLLPVINDDGRVKNVIGSITDITSTVEGFNEKAPQEETSTIKK